MKSSLVLCVLLGVVFSVRAASVTGMQETSTVPPSVEAVTVSTLVPATVTENYNDTTTTPTWTTTPPTPTATPTCCFTTPPMTTTTTTPFTTIPSSPSPSPMVSITTPFTTTQAPPSPSPMMTTTTPFTTIQASPSPSPMMTTTTPFTTTQASPSPSPMMTTTTPFTTTQAPPSPSQMACPKGWEVFLGRCYYFVNDGMTWPQAQSNCAMLESMLVSVHSAQEYGFLQRLTQNTGNQEAWLGGFYLQDQWLWMDGSWFYNNNNSSNSWSSESQDSSNPCLMLSSYEAWSNSQCNAGDYSSICVKNSNVPPSMLCPEGWTGFQGRCYFLNQESLSWPDADVNCAGLGASLVSVHSPEEYFFLYQQTAGSGYTATWLGGFYLEDQWIWLDGSWFYQGFFTQMSPDGTYPCLSTYNTDGWSNYECNQDFPSFCVKDAVV